MDMLSDPETVFQQAGLNTFWQLPDAFHHCTIGCSGVSKKPLLIGYQLYFEHAHRIPLVPEGVIAPLTAAAPASECTMIGTWMWVCTIDTELALDMVFPSQMKLTNAWDCLISTLSV